MTLPYLTTSVAPVEAEFRSTPEDFEVEEVPAYAPGAQGSARYHPAVDQYLGHDAGRVEPDGT
ncbi:MAG: hypothetical protein JRF48_01370 [Deltaproteobacteria bacterium]|nr:hypothetical protein [Deltaproteobacteria bacterium]